MLNVVSKKIKLMVDDFSGAAMSGWVGVELAASVTPLRNKKGRGSGWWLAP